MTELIQNLYIFTQAVEVYVGVREAPDALAAWRTGGQADWRPLARYERTGQRGPNRRRNPSPTWIGEPVPSASNGEVNSCRNYILFTSLIYYLVISNNTNYLQDIPRLSSV